MITPNPSAKSSRRRTVARTLSVAALVLAASQASAQSAVNFETPTTFTDTSVLDLPLSLSGYTDVTFAQAQNFGDNNNKTVVTLGGQSIFFTDSSEFNSAPTGTASAVFYGAGEWNAGLFAGDTGSIQFNDILDGQSWATQQPANRQTVRIGGLTIGETYIVQLLFSDMRGGSSGRTQSLADAISGATHDIFIISGPGNLGDSTVAAFTLYSATAIPEPSSFAALAGAFALTAVGLRRRRR
jgi:hypothetical protein